jgi:hypothetical protein
MIRSIEPDEAGIDVLYAINVSGERIWGRSQWT